MSYSPWGHRESDTTERLSHLAASYLKWTCAFLHSQKPFQTAVSPSTGESGLSIVIAQFQFIIVIVFIVVIIINFCLSGTEMLAQVPPLDKHLDSSLEGYPGKALLTQRNEQLMVEF